MQIKVTHKTVYGNELFYPANELATALISWHGAKSFTQADLKQLERGGFTVEVLSSYKAA